MFKNEIQKVVNAGKNKIDFLEKNPIGYFLASCLAGIFVGFGIVLIFTIGGLMIGQPMAKVVMGVSFGIALSLVIMAGSELFTGNNFVMGVASGKREIPWSKTAKLWAVCWGGNFIGAIFFAVIFVYSGLNKGGTAEFIAATSLAKTTAPVMSLFLRGMLCNALVCLAVWCSFKMETEIGKLVMIWWCLFAFITTGFEHSIANMTLLTIGLINPMGQAITIGGYFMNIVVVTLGNMVGAFVFLVIPYLVISKDV